MKKTFIILASLAAAATLASCNKEPGMSSAPKAEAASNEIVFTAEGEGLFQNEVSTKATEVSSLTSFNVGCYTGATGSSETQVFNVSFSKDGSTNNYKGGQLWPNSNPSYKFVASNIALTPNATGYTVDATSATDVVVANKTDATYKSSNLLTFDHIFARLTDVTVSAASGYSVSNVSLSITPKTGGTYSINAGAGHTDATGWSSLTTGTATGIANSSPSTKNNDIYLVPGDYELTAGWTATNGAYTRTYSNVKQTVSIVKGKKNKISTTLGGNASDIVFTVSINPWTETTLNPEFSAN